MASFRFGLERVLKWYRQQCEIEENRLTGLLAALASVEAGIARLREERQAVERDLLARQVVAAGDLVALGLYRLGNTRSAVQLENDRRLRWRSVEEQRGKVQAVRRRVRLVEKLRERRLEEYNYAEDRALESLAAESFLAKWTKEGVKSHVNVNSGD